MTPLYGHTSEDLAYLVADYPYGFKLRCQMKVWLEYRDGKGYRMVTRTSNPKKPGTWNKEKQSTYCNIAGNLFLDEEGHCHWQGIAGWENTEKLEKFLADFPGTDPAAIALINAMIKHNAKVAIAKGD